MINKNLKFLSAAFSLIVLGASAATAQDFNLGGIKAADIKSAQADKGIFDFIKPGKPETQPLKEWTVMVFMNAKNNLSESQLLGLSGKWAVKDIAEMKKVGTTAKINIVVEHGATGKGSRRLLIEKGGLLSSGEKVYGEFPNADMGDYKRVAEFVQWSKKTFPAKKYMLVLWNHGLGWIDPVMAQAPSGTGTSNKGILFDDETKNYVRTRQMGEMMRQAGYVDVLMQNACLQQMAEVLYEMKDYTGLLVGSEETMLAQGFDYEKLLNFMNGNTAFTDVQLSDFLMNWYKEFYAGGMHIVGPLSLPLDSIPATLSTVRPAVLNRLPGYLDAFAGAAMRNNETEAVKAAIANVIRFTSLDPAKDKKKMIAAYADLYNFAALFSANARSNETRVAADNLMSFIKNDLVLRSVGLHADSENGYDYTLVGGLAINTTMKIKTIPPQLEAIFETKYSELSLSKASQWDEFVTWTDGVWRK